MSKKQIKFLIPLGALLLTLVMLTGCRPSDALTRLMNAMNALNPSTEEMKTEEEQEEDSPDSQMDPIDEQRDDAQINETEEMIGQMLEDMDWETAQEALMTVYSASATSNEWGAQQYNPDRLTYGSGGALVLNVSGDEINSASKMAGSGEGNGNGTASVIEASEERDDNDLDAVDTELPPTEQSAETTPSPSETFGETQSASASTSAAATTSPPPSQESGNLPSDDGTTYTPPEYTNAGERIAATGEMAIVVCMLDGADRLCATSVSFDDNWLAQEAFNSNGQMEYESLWSGDGSYWLDNGDPDGDTFKYLMEYMQPDICFDFNYTSFSPEQADRMSDYNVTYVTMAAMTSRDNISACLRTVANYMDLAENGTPALTIVGDYEGWVTSELNALGYISTTAETVFIEDWDKDVLTMYNSENTGQKVTVTKGAAVIKIGSSFRPLNEYLKNSQVYDWASAPHMRGFKLDAYYGTGLSHGGMSVESCWVDMTGIDSTDKYGSAPGSLCYITPVYDPLFAADFSSQSVWFEGGSGQYSEIDNRVIQSVGTTDNGELSFGNVFPGYGRSNDTPDWCTVIAKNKTIKEGLDGDDAWQYSGATWSDSKRVGDGRETYNGTLHPINGSDYYYSTVAGNYTVYVNPAGMGNWVDGSPECILESIWAAWRVQGYYTEEVVRDKIAYFYNTFYGMNLDIYSEEITRILDGN